MANRGALGGLSEATLQAALLMDASGRDVVLLETVGVGQAEVDIIDHADTVVLVLMPGSGDSIQALKAGVMEIPDVIVVNKADHPLTDTMIREIKGVLALGPREGWQVPIVRTEAVRGEGIEELADKLAEHREFIETEGTLSERRRRNLMSEVLAIATFRMRRELEASVREDPEVKELLDSVVTRELDPASAAAPILEARVANGDRAQRHRSHRRRARAVRRRRRQAALAARRALALCVTARAPRRAASWSARSPLCELALAAWSLIARRRGSRRCAWRFSTPSFAAHLAAARPPPRELRLLRRRARLRRRRSSRLLSGAFARRGGRRGDLAARTGSAGSSVGSPAPAAVAHRWGSGARPTPRCSPTPSCRGPGRRGARDEPRASGSPPPSASLLERRMSRRSALARAAVAGSAFAVAPIRYLVRPGTAWAVIGPGNCRSGLCTDGYTAFCCEIEHGQNTCPERAPTSPAGGSAPPTAAAGCATREGVRYYLDCNRHPGPHVPGRLPVRERRLRAGGGWTATTSATASATPRSQGTTEVVCRLVICQHPADDRPAELQRTR